MSSERSRYVEIAREAVPEGLRWDVPRQNQGQIVEVAYADAPAEASEACFGSEYRRVRDRSDGRVTYHRRTRR